MLQFEFQYFKFTIFFNFQMDNMDHSGSFERNEILNEGIDQNVDDFRPTTERNQPYQQRTYRISQHQGFMEQALPSQYHATMKVATKIPPTSLRGIQHASQKTEQASRLIYSYSNYKKESLDQQMADEDLDPILDNDQGIAAYLENIDTDIFEIEEIKFCNLTQRITDEINGAKSSILFSREVPTKSMEIHGTPFNKEKASDSVKWIRCQIVQGADNLVVQMVAPTLDKDPHFIYEMTLDNQSYVELQKAQSIHTPFQEFGKRLATLLDYCILQLHSSSELKSRFTCVFNEAQNTTDQQTLYICEQNEFRHLVHLQLNFSRMKDGSQAEFYGSQNLIKESICQNYLKQKMIMIQKNRESCQAMLEINQSLKVLKEENQRVIEEARQKHMEELESLETTKANEIAALVEQHQRERNEIQRSKDAEIEQLRQENILLGQRLNTTQSNFEKEQINKEHVVKELQEISQRAKEYQSEIQTLKQKLETQIQTSQELEKDKLQLTLEGERKTSSIEGLEESVKDLKQKLLSESAELQQLKIDHTKLQQQSQAQKDNIEQLKTELEGVNASLESQKQETEKYKDKKTHLKDSLKGSQDENTRLQGQIADLERKLAESETTVTEKDQFITKKDQTLEVLQSKLKETQSTLVSNNTTIEDLKTSLAEAQKYSFRAILNNRSSAHHPPAPPVGYQGQFQNSQSAGQQTLSQFLKTNDPRIASNSPYRAPLNDEQLNTQPQPTYTASHRIQESYINVQNQNTQSLIQSQGFNAQLSNQKLGLDEQTDQKLNYSGAKHVKIPLTDYYANKFGGQGTGLRQTRPMVKPEEAPFVENLENENSVMLKVQQQMQRNKVPQVHEVYGGSGYKRAWNDQSYPRDFGNQFAQQLERDKIATEEHLKQTLDSQAFVAQNRNIPSNFHQQLERNDSKQSAMFGDGVNSGDIRRSSGTSGADAPQADLQRNSGQASQASFAGTAVKGVVVDTQKIEKELAESKNN